MLASGAYHDADDMQFPTGIDVFGYLGSIQAKHVLGAGVVVDVGAGQGQLSSESRGGDEREKEEHGQK